MSSGRRAGAGLISGVSIGERIVGGSAGAWTLVGSAATRVVAEGARRLLRNSVALANLSSGRTPIAFSTAEAT